MNGRKPLRPAGVSGQPKSPAHFCEGAENAVWVIKNQWQIYPALVLEYLPGATAKVQWRHGGTEVIYSVQVYATHAAAKAFVDRNWTLADVDADAEWKREAGW